MKNSNHLAPHRLRRGAIPIEFLLVCLALTGTISSACSQGAGEGGVSSKKLFVHDCWNSEFDLGPTFFGANPFSDNEMAIRVQRGDDNEEVSDGLSVMISDVQTIRNSIKSSNSSVSVDVGLPPGVSPPGIPLRLNPNPPTISLTLYLHDSCHIQNGAIYSIGGSNSGGTAASDGGTSTSNTITFYNLFSGNPNETNSDDRLTYARFDDIEFADPRDMASDYTFSPDVTSHVSGWFKFYFQRGQPAQPFP
jgi:hypothetical protein